MMQVTERCPHLCPHLSLLLSHSSPRASQTSELGVTEHIEGDPCKFALWVGRTPTSDNKMVLKVRAPDNTLITTQVCDIMIR